jgi:hypothetical protein
VTQHPATHDVTTQGVAEAEQSLSMAHFSAGGQVVPELDALVLVVLDELELELLELPGAAPPVEPDVEELDAAGEVAPPVLLPTP